ncbi:MAG: hypothetical protein HC914_08310 [Chloroflexaceae bacterium]|nr:hypothetical protein [Chloroflexaceae bacterium]
MAIMSEQLWRRHANPWSSWTRLLTYPLVYLPCWNRSWKQGVLVGGSFAINPLLFPKPDSTASWMTRGVLGEEGWTRRNTRDFATALNVINSAALAAALLTAWQRKGWPTLYASSTIARRCNSGQKHNQSETGNRNKPAPHSYIDEWGQTIRTNNSRSTHQHNTPR